MPPQIIAAGVPMALSIGGSLLSANAQKKAAQQATDATTAANNQATQAQLQFAQQSLGLERNIYNSNFNMLSPYVSRGNVAGQSINALLNLPEAPTLSAPLPETGGSGAPGLPQQPLTNIAAMQHDGIPGNYRNALAQMGVNQGGGGIPGIISPVGALLTGGRVF